MSRSDNKNLLHPDNENGIYIYEYPVINGIQQYVQVIGADRKNPLILFLHGGPGNSLAGICHIVQSGWEKRFTVANWDQRNTCKTYFANKPKAKEIAQTGSIEDFIRDTHEVIAYLHTVYDFEKLILMGFSWGSAIGAEYIKRYPEDLICYIGAGQHINYRDAVLFTCERLLGLVPKESPDEIKVRKMLDTFPQKPAWNRELMSCMKYFIPLGCKYIARHTKKVPVSGILCSPFLSLKEKLNMMIPDYSQQTKAYETMLGYDFRDRMNFEIPVLFVHGDEDLICPYGLLEKNFDEISAPIKKLAVLKEASHLCFYDKADEFMDLISEFISSIKSGQ